MLKLAAFLFCSFIALGLPGSMADSQDSSLPACALTDAPNQCGAFCLAALRPIIDKNRKTEEKLLSIENAQQDMRNHLVKTETDIFNVQAMDKLQSLENVQKELRSHLMEMETEIKSQMQSLQNSLEQLLNKTQAQDVSLQTLKYEKIGQRNFYIEDTIAVDYALAEATCRKRGGSLAKIEDYLEYRAIQQRFFSNRFWIDRFLNNLISEYPTRCVSGYGIGVNVVPCNTKAYFICQNGHD